MLPVRSGRWFDSVRWFLVCVLLAIVFRPETAFAATTVVTDAERGSDVPMEVGDTLEVRLPSNPSTGYTWYVHPKSTALLRLSGQSQTQATEPGAGRPVMQVFSFQPRRRGDGILLLRYVRSWEKPALGEEQFSLHVVVE
jgi:inhibitor of cysteine peptidase